jgi:uncharacterized spore protein YtfJ
MTNNVVEILKGVVGELREMAKSEVIVGQPITVGDKTVIPVVKLSLGFGAGGGQSESGKDGAGFGGGGGGGIRIEPSAFIIMDSEGIRLLPVKRGNIEGIIEAIPDLAAKFSQLKDKLKADKGDGHKERGKGAADEA